jgi:hypothetical protein
MGKGSKTQVKRRRKADHPDYFAVLKETAMKEFAFLSGILGSSSLVLPPTCRKARLIIETQFWMFQ